MRRPIFARHRRFSMSASAPRSRKTDRRGYTMARLLSLGFAAARGLGLVDRTEPAGALADLHLDLRIPAAGGLMIDAFAGPVDVALDGAVGRGCDRSRR